HVVAARLTLVAHAYSRGARLPVNGDVVVDDSAIGISQIDRVSGDRGGLYMHAIAVVDVVQVAPKRAVLDAAGHTEVGLGARGGARNPSTARDEVATSGRLRLRTS